MDNLHLRTEENLAKLIKYISSKAGGTSVSQIMRDEVMPIVEKYKAVISQSSCGDCQCCTNVKDRILDFQTKITQFIEHGDNESEDVTEKQKATEQKTPSDVEIPHGSQQEKKSQTMFDD